MEYIVTKRFNTKAICGMVDLAVGTICTEVNMMITYDGKPLCVVTSENAHQYFTLNNDGRGLDRRSLIDLIFAMLNNVEKGEERWGKVMADPICKKYCRPEHTDTWVWNHDFYNAPITDLQYIVNLIE